MCIYNLSFEFNSILDHVQVDYLTLAINCECAVGSCAMLNKLKDTASKTNNLVHFFKLPFIFFFRINTTVVNKFLWFNNASPGDAVPQLKF